MTQVQYGGPRGGLGRAELEALHERAMTVLTEVGLEVGHEETLAFLRARPGFRVEGKIVKPRRALVEECVAAVRARASGRAEQKGGEWTLHVLPGCPMYIADRRTGGVRPLTTADAVEAARLVDALHERGVRGTSPGVPQDVPLEIQPIRTFRIGAENCREGGSAQVASARGARWLRRLMEVMGQPYSLTLWVFNPLRVDGETLAQLYELRGEPIGFGVGFMPLLGVTAPIHIMGGFALGLAAAWGAYALVRELTGREDIGLGCTLWPVDMHSLEIVFGTPEMVLIDLAAGEIADFYGFGGGGYTNAFHSSAPLPDGQAASGRGAYGMAMALHGRRRFCWGGLLGVDLVFSPVQLMLDLELMRFYRHVIEGFPATEEAFCLDAIREAGPSGGFLGHASTLEGFGRVLWRPWLWRAGSVQAWQAAGSPRLEERIAAEIEELLRSHDYRLPDEKARALDEVCRAAEADLLGAG